MSVPFAPAWRIFLAGLALVVAACGGGNQPVETVAKAQAIGPSVAQAVTPKAQPVPFNGNGIWWNSERPGSGMFFEAQGATGVATFYAYESDGRPVWYTAAGPLVSKTYGTVTVVNFDAPLLRYSGGQAAGSTVPKTPTSVSMGTVSMQFDGNLAYVGLPGGKPTILTRFFRPAQPQAHTGIWWNPAQSGRGYAVEVADGQATIATFHYAVDGQPTWNLVVVPAGAAGQGMAGDFVGYSGGQTLTGAYKAPAPSSQGSFTAGFDAGCTGAFSFPGMAPIAVQRFAFDGLPLCDSSGQPPAPGPVGNLPVFYESKAITRDYEQLRQELQAAGTRGLRYLGEATGSTHLYAKTSNAPFAYLLLQGPWLAPDLRNWGAAGYRWGGWMGLYRDYGAFAKSTTGATYTYQVEAQAASGDLFLGLANRLGAEGSRYAFMQNWRQLSQITYVFEKDSQSSARYAYEGLPLPASAQALATQLSQQGARGFRFRRDIHYTVMLYEKDTTQSARFLYTVLPRAFARADFESQLQAQVAAGNAYLFHHAFNEGTGGDGSQYTIYFKPVDCAGITCEVGNNP